MANPSQSQRNAEETTAANKARFQREKDFNVINEQNRALNDMSKPKQLLLDAELFGEMAEANLQQARQLANDDQGRNAEALIKALQILYVAGADPQSAIFNDPSVFDWASMAVDVRRFFRQAPGVNCMLGPLDAQPKVRKAPTQRARRVATEASRPEELDNIAEQEKQETDRIMEEMWDVLQHGRNAPPAGDGDRPRPMDPIPVADLVCNLRSFAQTMENLFSLSFLVRDGRVRLYQSQEQGMMMAQGVGKQQRSQKAGPSGKGEQRQFVLSMTEEFWRETMCKLVRPEDCCIKHRTQQEEHEQVLQKRRKTGST